MLGFAFGSNRVSQLYRHHMRRVQVPRKTGFKQVPLLAMAALMIAATLFALPRTTNAAEQKTGIVINVVYDDSTSMITSSGDPSGNPLDRWSQAKYALEVFSAMLGENDVMNIYPMSLEGEIGFTLYGSDPDRVSTVHAMNGARDTPFGVITAAADDLRSEADAYERWLVVITDGYFYNNGSRVPVENVQSALDGLNDEGIHTVFLGIGDDAPTLKSNEAKGGYALTAKDGSDVLKKVTGIANQIFSHQVLPGSNISKSGNTYSLDIDIPTGQIVVFAQGTDASVGDLFLEGEKLTPSLVQNVRHSGDVLPSGFEGVAKADTSLNGVLAVYEASGDPYESGTFTIDAAGSAGVEIYYRPGVLVNCDLLQNGAVVNRSDELYAGAYDVSVYYVNPLDGKPIESNLLPSNVFSLEVDNNGSIQKLDGAKGS
ncbi:MAG: hypothetical protein Q4D39_01655, partial [Coriobacteriaceae bacterium]|nr:hypothetical protein [Coriobacteriaceae bacterium]